MPNENIKDMLISLSEVLETPVGTLLEETVIETEVDTLKAHFRKIGGGILATGTKENLGKKNYSLVAYFVHLCVFFIFYQCNNCKNGIHQTPKCPNIKIRETSCKFEPNKRCKSK